MNKDSQPGINFKKIVIEKVQLETNPDYYETRGSIPVDIAFKINRDLIKSKRLLKLSLDVSLFDKTNSPPFRIFISIAGYFTVENDDSLKNLEKFSDIQAPALIFPFVREFVADLTMRTGYPPLLLPPINITALVGQAPKKVKQKSKSS
jgi:preprotein translocase subunit SecB